MDEFGNFHVIGEVNNTSTDPQSNILITDYFCLIQLTML